MSINLSFKECLNAFKQKLNRTKNILAKLRYYVTASITQNNLLHTFWLSYEICNIKFGEQVTVKHSIWFNTIKSKP